MLQELAIRKITASRMSGEQLWWPLNYRPVFLAFIAEHAYRPMLE
jgi:hypothetical protein